MKHKVLIFILFIIVSCKSLDQKEGIKTNEFEGNYHLVNPNNQESYHKFSVFKENGTYFFKFKEKNSEKIEISILNLDSLKSDFYSNLPKETKVIGNMDKDVILFKTEVGWEYNGFKCETGYFMMTIIGPVNTYRN